MNSVRILFITDNNDGKRMAHALLELGLFVEQLSLSQISAEPFKKDVTSFLVVDVEDSPISEINSVLSQHGGLDHVLKFVVIKSALISKALEDMSKLSQIEIIEKPYNNREFILLLEKSIIVEKYREIMRQLSLEYEKRIENYESIFHFHKNEILSEDDNTDSFERILDFEKKLIEKQNELNNRLEEFSYSRKKDLLDIKNMLFAKEMLDQLREKELLYANDTIHAQEQVIEFSSHEIDEKSRLLEAHERVVELSRDEAIRLHHTIQTLQNEKKYLQEENQKLKQELLSSKEEK